MSRMHQIKAKLLEEKTVTKLKWQVNIEGYKYFYTEVVNNDDGEDVNWSLENEYGREIKDVDLLQVVQESVNAVRWDLNNDQKS